MSKRDTEVPCWWRHPIEVTLELCDSYWNEARDINQTSASGCTPLIAAVYRNRSCVSGLSCLIDLLLTSRADINARAEDGRTALGYAVFRQMPMRLRSSWSVAPMLVR